MTELDDLKAAWHIFCQRLQAEGDGLLANAFYSVDERAQGLRQRIRCAVTAVEWRVERTDTSFPVLLRMNDDRPSDAVNVDITYLRAQVHGDMVYRIHAEAGDRQFIIYAATGDFSDPLAETYLGELWRDELTANPDGSYDVTIGGEPAAENWMALAAGQPCWVAVRQYFLDWSDRDIPGFFSIDRIDGPTTPSELTAELLAGKLQDAVGWLDRVYHYLPRSIPPMSEDTINVLSAPKPFSHGSSGGSQKIAYGRGFYDLRPDQALVVELSPPANPLWNIATYNIWGDVVDFQNRQCSLNGAQAYIRGDELRVVVSAVDVGHPNWLDTGGNKRGLLWYRMMHAPEFEEKPRCIVLQVDEVWRYEHADTPRVDSFERRRRLAERRMHITRRFVR